MQFRFTRLGRFLLLLIMLFYAASITSQSGLLLLFIGLLVAMIVLNFIVAIRTVKSLRVEAPREVFLAEGEKMSQPWRIINPVGRQFHMVYLNSPVGTLLKLAVVRRNETLSLVPDLKFNKRGIFPNNKTQVKCAAPFGFIEAVKTMEVPGQVVVYPAIYGTEAPHAAALDNLTGGKFTGQRRTTSGANFAGVRPWAAGDPIKQIHWKSSAKRAQLMVKTFDEELSGRISILLDCNGAEKEAAAENAIRAAGSLIFAALEAGHFVELCVLPETDRLLIPPFADGTEALLRLAKVEVSGDLTKISALDAALDQVSRKAAIIYLGTVLNERKTEWLHKVHSQGRKVSVYLPREGSIDVTNFRIPLFLFAEKEINTIEQSPAHALSLSA
jgi:uncharacterized protein (DUF58 family)